MIGVEFYIKMRDLASGAMNKVKGDAAKLQDAMKRGGLSVSELQTRINQLSQSRDLISSSNLQSIRAANREIQKLGKEIHKIQGAGSGGLRGTIRDAMKSIPAFATNPLVLAAGAVSAMIGGAAKEEQQKVGLSTFLGKQGAESAFANVKKDADATTFDTGSLLDVNMALISTGLSAEKARADTMNLANAIAASGKGNDELMRMASNMQQIKNVGKATATDIKQFGMAGINIYGVLANSIYNTAHATQAQMESVTKMEVTYETLAQALADARQKGGIFYHALEAQAETTSGKFDILWGNIKTGAAELGKSLLPVANFVLEIGNTVFEVFRGAAAWIKENGVWLSFLAKMTLAAYAAYKAFFFWQKLVVLWSQRMAIWNGIVTASTLGLRGAVMALNAAWAANPIGIIIAAVVALVAAFMMAWNEFEGFRQFFYSLWETIKQIFSNIAGLFKKIFSPIFDSIAAFKEGRYWDAAKAAGKMALNLTPIGIVRQTVDYIKEGGATKGLGKAWERGKENSIAADQANAIASGAKDAAGVQGTPAADASKELKGIGAGTEKVIGGGQKTMNIHINKLVEKIEIHTSHIEKGLDNVREQVEETFLRVLNSGAAAN